MSHNADSDHLTPYNSSSGALQPRLGRAGWKGFWAAIRDNRGSFLLETVVASIIFALVGTAVLSSLGTVNIAGALTEEQSQAENIARNQMEAIFEQVYREPDQTPYPAIAVPAAYSVGMAVTHWTESPTRRWRRSPLPSATTARNCCCWRRPAIATTGCGWPTALATTGLILWYWSTPC